MNDVDEIRSRLDIVDIIGKRVTLKKNGRNFKGLCPFHSEKTPSFVVSPDRQIFHCFGCGKGGSIFDFVMEFNHVDFPEALEELAEMAGVTLTRRSADTPEGKLKQRIFEVNHLASEYYQYLLTKHTLGEKARAYLKNRGISDKSIQTFSLGYSPNSWDALSAFLRKKGYDNTLLTQAGLSIKGRTYYDRFRGRVMFALKDHRGNIAGFAGRLLDPDIKEAKYINTAETPVYVKGNVLYGLDVTKGAIQKENEAIVMEGELDVISSFQAGISNAVAIKGSALTEAHVRLLRRFTDRLAFALDSDMAGDAASRRGIEIADAAGMDMRVVRLPSGKDPDEAAREDAVAFKKAIKNAVPVYDYFISSASARFDATTVYGKKKVSEELLPILAKIENQIVQGHYIRKLAGVVGVPEETIADSVAKVKRTGMTKSFAGPEERTKKAGSREEKLEVYTLALLLQGKTQEWLEEFREYVATSDIKQSAVAQALETLIAYVAEKPVFLMKDFVDALPKELVATVDQAYLWDLSDVLDNEELMEREWTQALRELRKLVLRRNIMDLSRKAPENGQELSVSTAGGPKTLRELTAELKVLEKISLF